VPEQRSGEDEPGADQRQGELAPPARPLPLERLLSVATLTPAQAALVAVQLLDAAGDPGNGPRPAARLGPVAFTPSGVLEVGRAPANQGRTLGQALGLLVENARRLPAHPRPGQLLLLRRLEEAANEPVSDPAARSRALEQALADTVGADGGQRLTGQLAALVQAFTHVAGGGPAGPSRQAVPRATPAATAPRRTAAHQPATRRAAPRRALLPRRTRGRAVLAAVVVAAVLAVSGYVVVGGPGSGIVRSLGRGDVAGAPDTSAPTAPARQPSRQPEPSKQDRAKAIAGIAPSQAGEITGVLLQRSGACAPGGTCPVKVTVRFRPASTAHTITWKVGAARVCSPGVVWSPPVGVTAQPGWSTVYASSSVRVPKGRSFELVAVTTSPDRAQSRPVPVPGSAQRC
jgi:hypothetical protein